MRTDFTLQRVCGTTYRRGNLLFADSGMTLCVPTGNQLSEHNVVSGVVRTYASSTLNDIACFDLSREGTLMVCVDIKGFGYFINRRVDIALERAPFPRTTTCVKFSHNGMYVAVGSYGELQIWTTPIDGVLQYRSVRMITRYTHVLQGDIATLEWAQDDSHILVCGTDATIRILPRRRVWEANTRMHLIATLVAQKTPVIASFFSTDINDEIIGVSVDRCLVTWKQNAEILRHDLLSEKWRLVHQEISDDEDDTLGDETQKKRLKTEARTEANYEALVGNQEDVDLASLRLSAYHWDISQKEYISSNSRISSVAYNQQKKIIVCGMADGSFIISHLEPKLVMLHTLSITAQQVSSVAISPTGDWVAFGSTKLHQLMVWDWAAESYVLRHQAHASDINAVCYSSNGLYLISVGEDGKMKVWSTKTGQCVATFKDHEGAIVSVVPNTGNAVFTASADGTLRGYDLQSMKLFRLMKPNESIQLACISLDPSGELIAAGTIASGRIYLFSTQTGRLVDEFTGHTACVAALDFHPLGTLLSSVSWDETCRIYDIFGTDDSSGKRLRSSVEVVGMGSMGLCTRFSPNGNMLAVLSYASEVTLYDVSRGELAVLTSWNVERDSRGGYNCLHNNNPKSRNCRRPFTTMAFSPDGTSLILAGDSKWICMYSVRGGFLLRKWSVTTNHSVEGNVEQYNWRAFNSEIGSTQTIDDDDSDVEDRFRKLIKLPGVAKGEHAVGKRAKTLVSRTKWLTFAQNGREWVAASSIGLCVYSLDTGRNSLLFIPHHFVAGVTPKRVQQHLTNGSYYSALIGALSLSIPELIDKVISTIPLQRAQEVIAVVPVPLLMALMEAVARILNRGLLWELSSQWCHEILLHHGQYFKSSILNVRGMPVSENTMKVEDGTIAHLRLLLQAQSTHSEIINRMNENRYTVDYWAKLLAK